MMSYSQLGGLFSLFHRLKRGVLSYLKSLYSDWDLYVFIYLFILFVCFLQFRGIVRSKKDFSDILLILGGRYTDVYQYYSFTDLSG